ncbi:hypothetical protein [Symbioplanes lichenis]|uniref:hypothetical protein n=1 Tax=Symbioplanes lichenis TaxID=1629072 RepID=UPI0027382FFF|nr:hypothetical protein [Actinoplanes lichenis]
MEKLYGDPGTTLFDMAASTNAALHANPFPQAPQNPSSSPPRVDTVTPAVGTPATDTRAMPAEWQQAYDDAPPYQLRTERYVPSKQPFVAGTHQMAGENTTINFRVREFTAPDGTPVRAYDLNLDLVSKNDAVTPQQRLDYARAVQNTVNEMVNGRHTFPDGRQLHVNVTFNTLAWRDGMLNDWQDDPRRNPPIELVTDPTADTHQHQWNTNDSVAVAVHELMHYLGDNEGYKSDERLLRTEIRPGVMGQDVRKLPVSRSEADEFRQQNRPTDYLTDADLRLMQDVAQTAGPVRDPAPKSAPAPKSTPATETTSSMQSPSRAPRVEPDYELDDMSLPIGTALTTDGDVAEEIGTALTTEGDTAEPAPQPPEDRLPTIHEEEEEEDTINEEEESEQVRDEEPPPPANNLPGLYSRRPELLRDIDLDPFDDPDTLIRDVRANTVAAVDRHARATHGRGPGAIDVSEITRALSDEPQSFFDSGGRSFDVRAGRFGRHYRVTVVPEWDAATATVLPSSHKPKYDTKTDGVTQAKEKTTAGQAQTIGGGVLVPRLGGIGGGVSADVQLAETVDEHSRSTKLLNSSTVRSGGGSQVVSAPTSFRIVVSKARGPVPDLSNPGPAWTEGTPATTNTRFRAVDDIAGAQPRDEPGEQGAPTITLTEQTSLFVENFTPEHILEARMGNDGPQTLNGVRETLLNRFAPTGTTDPGSNGAGRFRGIFSDKSLVATVIGALENPAHPEQINSKHGLAALFLELGGTLTGVDGHSDIGKSTFRMQTGVTESAARSQTSPAGFTVNVIPVRGGLSVGYVQLRVIGGVSKTQSAESGSAGQVRSGTEFKDVPNVAVEARIRLGVSSTLNALPLAGDRPPPDTSIELVVSGRMPTDKVRQLYSAAPAAAPEGSKHAPSYLSYGGRSAVSGTTGYADLRQEVTDLLRQAAPQFLPRYDKPSKRGRMFRRRSASERNNNQLELDNVLSPLRFRSDPAGLATTGVPAILTRTRPHGTDTVVLVARSSQQGAPAHQGITQNVGVRAATAGRRTFKQSTGIMGRWGLGVEGGGRLVKVGEVTGIVVPGGAIEYSGQYGRRGTTKLAGQEMHLQGGTQHSETFTGDQRITVDVYAWKRRFGFDPTARLKFGRRLRPLNVTPPDASRLQRVRKLVWHVDKGAATDTPAPPLRPRLHPADGALPSQRQTQLDAGGLRQWVDGQGRPTVALKPADIISVLAMPGSEGVLQLAQNALTDLQTRTDAEGNPVRESRTRLRGERGTAGLRPGMPAAADLLNRLTAGQQIGMVSGALADLGHIDNLTDDSDGVRVDMALALALTDPALLPGYTTGVAERTSGGEVEVGSSRTKHWQVAARAFVNGLVRQNRQEGQPSRVAASAGAAYERLLHASTRRDGETVAGAIERNMVNRKGRARSVAVKFNLNASLGADVRRTLGRTAPIPLRWGSWRFRHRSIQRNGTIDDGLVVAVTPAAATRLNLFQPLRGDNGAIGDGWQPSGARPDLRLPPGHSVGLGLYNLTAAPGLNDRLDTALREAIQRHRDERRAAAHGFLGRMRDLLRIGRPVTALEAAEAGLDATGLRNPILNGRQLRHLATDQGVAQHFSALTDGGAAALITRPNLFSRSPYEAVLVAEEDGDPEFLGFVADHGDIDVKATLRNDTSRTHRTAHGDAVVASAGVAGLANSTNVAAGPGDRVGAGTQSAQTDSDTSSTSRVAISSARGVKARMRFPMKFSLKVYRDGKLQDTIEVARDSVEQERWADDLRAAPQQPEAPAPPATYEIPGTVPPGWTEANGLPLPQLYTPENIARLDVIRVQVAQQLADAARQLWQRTTGGTARYAGEGGFPEAHQIRQRLTPELLLPAVHELFSDAGFTLPPAVSDRILGRRASITVKLTPESATLSGVSSGVYREHAGLTSSEAGSSHQDTSRALRGPGLSVTQAGTGDLLDPTEGSNPGALSNDIISQAEGAEIGSSAAGVVKPEDRSALLEYQARSSVSVTLAGGAATTSTYSSGPSDSLIPVQLRMALSDAETALGLTDGTDQHRDFQTVARHETDLAAAAARFVTANEALEDARIQGLTLPQDSDARRAVEDSLPALHRARDEAGQAWWTQLADHHRRLDDFAARHQGVPAGTAPAPRSLYESIAGALPPADGVTADQLAAAAPYRTPPGDRDARLQAAADAAKVHLVVHNPDGTSEQFRATGGRPRGTLNLTRGVSPTGEISYEAGLPPAPVTLLAHDEPHPPAPTGAPAAAPAPAHVPGGGLIFPGRGILGPPQHPPVTTDRYVVEAHGNRNVIFSDSTPVTPAELAAIIRADPEWGSRPIVLIACDTGVDKENGFAAQLARELPGTRVLAPAGLAWTGKPGFVTVTSTPDHAEPTSDDVRYYEFFVAPHDPELRAVVPGPFYFDGVTPLDAPADHAPLVSTVQSLGQQVQRLHDRRAGTMSDLHRVATGDDGHRDAADRLKETANRLEEQVDDGLDPIEERQSDARDAIDELIDHPALTDGVRDQLREHQAAVKESFDAARAARKTMRALWRAADEARDSADITREMRTQAADLHTALEPAWQGLKAISPLSAQIANLVPLTAAMPPGDSRSHLLSTSLRQAISTANEAYLLDNRMAVELNQYPRDFLRSVAEQEQEAGQLLEGAKQAEPAAVAALTTARDRLAEAGARLTTLEALLDDVVGRLESATPAGVTLPPITPAPPVLTLDEAVAGRIAGTTPAQIRDITGGETGTAALRRIADATGTALRVHRPGGGTEDIRPVGTRARQLIVLDSDVDLGNPAQVVAHSAPAPMHLPGGGLIFPGRNLGPRSLGDSPSQVPDRYYVVGHGSRDAMSSFDVSLSPAEVAAQIRADPEWRGRPILLVACHTGEDRENGFAARLARELPGTRIFAPGGIGWYSESGFVVVADPRRPGGELPPENRFYEFRADPDHPEQLTVHPGPVYFGPATPLDGPADPAPALRTIEALDRPIQEIHDFWHAELADLHSLATGDDSPGERAGTLYGTADDLDSEVEDDLNRARRRLRIALADLPDQARAQIAETAAAVRAAIRAAEDEHERIKPLWQAAAAAQESAEGTAELRGVAAALYARLDRYWQLGQGIDVTSRDAVRAARDAATLPPGDDRDRLIATAFRDVFGATNDNADMHERMAAVLGRVEPHFTALAVAQRTRTGDLIKAAAELEAAAVDAHRAARARIAEAEAGLTAIERQAARNAALSAAGPTRFTLAPISPAPALPATVHATATTSRPATAVVSYDPQGRPRLAVARHAPAAVEIPGGLALLDDGDGPGWDMARKHQPRPGEYAVFVGGRPDSPERLVERINADPRSYGKEIVLVGVGGDYADRLAGQPGIGAVRIAWMSPAGRLLSAGPGARLGSWRRHDEGQRPHDAVLTA